MKELYTITIQKETEAGKVPVKVFLKKPGAQQNQLIGVIYAAELSKALKMGIMSEVDIRRTIQDAGGFKHSKNDKSKRDKLIEDWQLASNKRELLLSQNKNTDKITEKLLLLKKEVEELDKPLNKVLENSAEVIAYQRTLDWMTANLTFWDEDKSPVFTGEDDDEKIKSYFAALDEDNSGAEVIRKASVIFQGYLMNGIKEKEVFEVIEKELDELTAQENIS